MFSWLENLDGGTKSYFALAMGIVGYAFLIAALGWLGLIGTVLLVGSVALWTVAEDKP